MAVANQEKSSTRKSHRRDKEFVKLVEKHMASESAGRSGQFLSEVILGGQDGVVNVLGIVLGIATATNDRSIVLISGLVATFAESISMAAVAYASSRAEQDHYTSVLEKEKWEIRNLPEVEEEEIRLIYMKKGFRGKELEGLVKSVTSNKELWLSTMMTEELGLAPVENSNPVRASIIVGLSAVIGSLIPLVPFAFLPVGESIPLSLAFSTLALFGVGAYKAKTTVGNWLKSGIEMAGVGMLAALAGYFVGSVLGKFFGLNGVQG